MEFLTKNAYPASEQINELKRIFTANAKDTHGQALYKFTMGLVGMHKDTNQCFSKIISQFIKTYEIFTEADAQQLENSIIERGWDRKELKE